MYYDFIVMNIVKKTFLILLFLIGIASVEAHEDPLEFFKCIPSAIEILSLCQEKGFQYDTSNLHFKRKLRLWQTENENALQLGIAFTDLEYALLNKDQISANQIVNYIQILLFTGNTMPDLLQCFQYGLLKTNLQNLSKTLLHNRLLQEKLKNDWASKKLYAKVNALLLGSWLEVQHILGVASKSLNSNELNECLAFQKISLDQILLLMSFSENESEIFSWQQKLNDFQILYEKVKLNYTYSEKLAQSKIEDNIIYFENVGDTALPIYALIDLRHIQSKIFQLTNDVIDYQVAPIERLAKFIRYCLSMNYFNILKINVKAFLYSQRYDPFKYSTIFVIAHKIFEYL